MLFSGIFDLELAVWTWWTVNLPKKWSECVYLKKKLSLFKEVAIFSIIIISFRKRFYWYVEILLFSSIFGLEPVVWAMWTVNLQEKRPECVYLKIKLSLFKEVAIFSITSFSVFSISCSFLYNHIQPVIMKYSWFLHIRDFCHLKKSSQWF